MTALSDSIGALPCWLAVDLDAVAANVAALRRWVSPTTGLAAVVKAQGYGAGAEEVAQTALAAGASWLAVARVHEAQELRHAGIHAPILVLTRTDPSEADLAVRLNLAVTVDGIDLARALGAAAVKQGCRAHVHIKVDTGLHRFGVEPERALPLARGISTIDGLDVQALYTHFANADEPDLSYTLEQFQCFEFVTSQLAGAGYCFPMRHAANSAAALALRRTHLNLVRLGLTLYGASPSGEVPPDLDLLPAVALQARIARTMALAPGEAVGYGQTWRAHQTTRVGVASAGYADGVPRQLSNRGVVLVHGQEAPIIGRVSMDMTTVDITRIPTARVGSVVTFFGRDGAAEIDLSRFARTVGTIPHDALSAVGGRVARVYLRDGAVHRLARLSGTVDVP